MSASPENESIIERVARQLEPGDRVERTAAERATPGRTANTATPASGFVPEERIAVPQGPVNQSARGADNHLEIDLGRLERSGLVSPKGGRKRLLDEFRIIKRSVLRTAFQSPDSTERNRNLVMVTSANSGEGKTSTSVSLAMSVVSEQDRPVLLVDLDPVRQDLSRTLGAIRRPGERPGLLDLLGDSGATLTDTLLTTNVSRLNLLPAGADNPLSNELLSGPRMAALMEDLSRWYRDGLVIIDTPPVLASTEPNVLAMYVGQAILVVEANRTERADIDEALSLIQECDNISFVLNKTSSSETSYYYGKYHRGYRK